MGRCRVRVTQTDSGYRSVSPGFCSRCSPFEHTRFDTHMQEMATWRKVPLPDLLTLIYNQY